jgi:hypothetical protein
VIRADNAPRVCVQQGGEEAPRWFVALARLVEIGRRNEPRVDFGKVPSMRLGLQSVDT